jgi:alpha-L-rhamnosidase
MNRSRADGSGPSGRAEWTARSWALLARVVALTLCWLAVVLGPGPTAMALNENQDSGSLRPMGLRCDGRETPLSVGTEGPRLSWVCAADDPARRGLRQSAYQVLVASSRDLLRQDRGDLWDSGRVASGKSVHVRYAGRPLTPRARCLWKVRIWDQDSRPSAFSEPAEFATGLTADDWTAQWIAAGTAAGPLPLLRREFDIKAPVRRALVYVCGLGHYELQLNGCRVGDQVLDPGWTNYRKTCLFSTYDVTGQIAPGRNAVAAMLGNGMYNVAGGRYVKFRGSFGPPKMILQLEVEHTDGTSTIVTTDDSWKMAPGPIHFSCIFGGEDYDGRDEIPGWDRPGLDDKAWRAAEVVAGPGGVLRPQTAPPVKVMEQFSPVRISAPDRGALVYDLGQNFSGWPRLTVRGPAGASVKMIPGELLDSSGLVTQRSSGGPVSFAYTLRGDETETWSPRFSYYGFRYLQVEGAVPEDRSDAAADLPRVLDLKGQFLHNSADVVGGFVCSSPLVNRIHALINAAIRSNFQSVLTDCPHREKLGWLEVSHLLARGIMYNYDVPGFYAKISRDMRESQCESGLVPDIAPEYTVFDGGFRDSPEWGSACAMNAWHVYQMYGDASLLRRHHDVIERYVAYLGGTAQDHIVAHGLGDWYDIGPNPPGPSQLTSNGLTATAIYYGDIRILAATARLLGQTDDARRYDKLAAAVAVAFNGLFFHPEKNLYDRGSQTAQAMPLVLGLVPEDRREAVLASLVDAIRQAGDRVTAGDVGFMYVVRALSDGDRGDLLYRMICQESGPGYADQLRQGATTLTEAWDANPASSQNHCMLGHAEEWFYRGLAGIVPDPEGPGFKRFILKPQVVGDLTWVRAHYDSIHGRIVSRWKVADGRFQWDVTVPPNTTATLFFPALESANMTEGDRSPAEAPGIKSFEIEADRAVMKVDSGIYHFEAPR